MVNMILLNKLTWNQVKWLEPFLCVYRMLVVDSTYIFEYEIIIIYYITLITPEFKFLRGCAVNGFFVFINHCH